MLFLKFKSIKCNSTEGWVTDDKIYLKVNGNKVWGDFKIGKGETKDLSNVSSVEFAAPLLLQLYDHDTFDPDDFLGSAYVVQNDYNTGEKTTKFNKDDADYDLVYEICEEKFIEFENIKCNSTEGWITDDKIYLKVNGNKVWGNYKMGKGDTKDLSHERHVSFFPDAKLDLYDSDTLDTDDHLGSHTVSSLGKQTLSFKDDGANYDLNINVVDSINEIITRIKNVVGETADGSKQVSRDNLELPEDFKIHIDVGGEGYKTKEIEGHTSGFKAAINLNNTDKTTTTPPYYSIPYLVKITQWGIDYPFSENFADYITMQGCPLNDSNVNQIARVIAKNGEIGLWIDTDNAAVKNQIEKLAAKVNSKPDYNCYDEFGKESMFKKVKIVANKS